MPDTSSQRLHWKRIVGYPFASAINLYNRTADSGGFVLRVPDWQHNYPAWTRDLDPHVIVHTVHGFEIRCNAYDYVGQHVIADRDWESLIARTLATIARPGSLCLDIGANMGFHTLVMGQAVGPSGRVIAFEPDQRNLSSLIYNIRLNGMRHILPVGLGLSDSAAIVYMAEPSGVNYGAANMREQSGGNKGQPAMVVRADSLPLLKGADAIALIKLDVEGFEENVLRGLGSVLDRVQHIVCEISPEWVNTEAIFALLANAGFNFVAAPPFHEGRWFKPETCRVQGQHDVLFYRTWSPELAAMAE